MNPSTLQTISQFVLFGGLILSAAGGLGTYWFGKKVADLSKEVERERIEESEAISAHVGVLEPDLTTLFSSSQRIYPEVEFGDSGAVLVWAGKPHSPMFAFAEENELTISLEGDQIRISTSIRDSSGSIVAELAENEWKLNPGKTWDRNYTNNALEVRDASGDIVLQVRLIGHRVQLQAKFYDSTGGAIGFGKVYGPSRWGGGIEKGGIGVPLKLQIEPMFKYPSELHLGEFVDQK